MTLVAATALEFGVSISAIEGSAVAQQAFPYSSALFGVAAVGFFREAEPFFRGRVASAVGFWLGRISYSAYLFHIVIVMAMKPMIADWPLLAQLALYVALICAFSTVFWRGFERPILAARPNYAPSALLSPQASPIGPQARSGDHGGARWPGSVARGQARDAPRARLKSLALGARLGRRRRARP